MSNPHERPLVALVSDHNRRSLDSELDAHLEADPGDFNPPSRRKDAELNRVLAILDEIEEEGGFR